MADLLDLTAEIVTAHVTGNAIEGENLPALIKSVYDALANAALPEKPVPGGRAGGAYQVLRV